MPGSVYDEIVAAGHCFLAAEGHEETSHALAVA
jgi:hypothetical protein